MMPDLKPVWGWPGYYVSADGQIWSSRNSMDGSLKQLKIREDGRVLLSNSSKSKYIQTSKLVETAYGKRTE